ncbi:MAG: hypothetical protein ACI9JM_002629 [Halioglobus sp.]|jgi:hypothetical protein
MAARGLSGIWGLEWIDSTGYTTWKLLLLAIASCGFLWLLSLPLLSDVNTALPMYSADYAPGLIKTIGAMFLFVIGLYGMVTITMARLFDEDLAELLTHQPQLEQQLNVLAFQWRPFIGLLFLHAVVILPLFFYSDMLAFEATASERAAAFFSDGLGPSLNWFVLIPLVIGLQSLSAMQVLLQARTLASLVAELNVELYALALYNCVSNAAVRVVMGGMILLSFLILVTIPYSEIAPNVTYSALLFVIAILLVLAGLLALFMRPVYALRNKIRAEKERELADLRFRIKALHAGERGSADSLDALVTLQMFVESRWEWPIASHIQKVALFGLLPPLTWVLAGAVENALY